MAMQPQRACQKPRTPRLLLLLGGLLLLAAAALIYQKGATGSTAAASSGSGRLLTDGEIARQLNAMGMSSRPKLEPELLRQLWKVALLLQQKQPEFMRWTKDIGLLRLEQHREYKASHEAGRLQEVDAQAKPRVAPDLTSTYIDADLLRQAFKAAKETEKSELRFVQWLRGAGLLTEASYSFLENRLRKDKDAVQERKKWLEFRLTWEDQQERIAERRRAAES